MLRDLVAHKGHANAAMLAAIRDSAAAAADQELTRPLHHVLLANRFWLLTVMRRAVRRRARVAARRLTRRADRALPRGARAGNRVAGERLGRRSGARARQSADSRHSLLGGAGMAAGVPALARASRPGRDAAAATRRHAAVYRLHRRGCGSVLRRSGRRGGTSGLSSPYVQRLPRGASGSAACSSLTNRPGLRGRRALRLGRRASESAAHLARTGL